MTLSDYIELTVDSVNLLPPHLWEWVKYKLRDWPGTRLCKGYIYFTGVKHTRKAYSEWLEVETSKGVYVVTILSPDPEFGMCGLKAGSRKARRYVVLEKLPVSYDDLTILLIKNNKLYYA